MTRYTINIGDDFPLGGDEPSGRGGDPGEAGHRHRRRHGLFLRVLFFLAVAAIVISHPLHTLLIVGAVLLVRRSPWFAEARERIRTNWRNGGWRDGQWSRQGWNAWQSRCRARAQRRDEPRAEQQGERGYRGFV